MIPRQILLTIVFAMSLSACGSVPPLRLFQLSPDTGTDIPVAYGGPSIAMGDVTLPKILDRLDIVRETDSARMLLEPAARWAAPLDEMARAALTVDLQTRLPQGVLLRDESAPGDATNVIDVTVDRFAADATGHVVLDVAWKLSRGNPEKTIERRYEQIAVDARSPGTDAMVEAMNKALATLATRIADGLPSQ